MILIVKFNGLCLKFHSWSFVCSSRVIFTFFHRYLLMGLSKRVSFILQFLNNVLLSDFEVDAFGIVADLGGCLHQSSCFGLGRASWLGCQAFIGFLALDMINLQVCFHPFQWSTGSLLKSLGSVFVSVMVGKPERTCILVI